MSRSSRLSPSRDYINKARFTRLSLVKRRWTMIQLDERVRDVQKLDSSRPLYKWGNASTAFRTSRIPSLSLSRERERTHARFDVPQNVTREGVEQCCVASR